jgi:hypothetical protein
MIGVESRYVVMKIILERQANSSRVRCGRTSLPQLQPFLWDDLFCLSTQSGVSQAPSRLALRL